MRTRCCNNELPSPVYPIVNTEGVSNKPGNTEEIACICCGWSIRKPFTKTHFLKVTLLKLQQHFISDKWACLIMM